MSLCYKISTELNMILYLGEGYSTPSDFFALEKAAFLKYPRNPGMITLVDAFELSTAFDLSDIHRFIDNINRMAKNGMEPGPYIMLTKDRGLHLLADAAKLIAGNVDLKARMYYTLQEAIVGLGLSDHKKEIIQLWNECKIGSSRTSGDLANIKTLKQAT
jgi:hypothetical protein